MPGRLRWFLLLTALVAVFFWKILFTSQFSVLLNSEGTNQTYAWYSYAARTIQRGILPAWDPYNQSGRSFIGESQTGLFYPLKYLLFLAPLDRNGLISERIFHELFVLAHLLAAFFMFLCAREVGIKNNFAAFTAAVCFSLGGFTGQVGWPYMLDSVIWLPLIFYFLLRALRSRSRQKRMLYSCLSGLALAMTVLAGSIHVLFMDVLVILSAAGLYAIRPEPDSAAAAPTRSAWFASAVVILTVAVISFAASSVQLLPSMEYAPLARRWTGEWSGLFMQRIPYEVTGTLYRLTPRAIFAFLFGRASSGGAEYGPYFGVMPLLLAVIGIRVNWGKRWVKYLAVLAVLAFLLALGDYSLLNGLFYLFIPYFDKVWEAGRYIYLTHFAMALLAGFGVQSLFSDEAGGISFYPSLLRWLNWLVIAVLVGLGIPDLLGKPDLGEWPYVSGIFVLASWATYRYIVRGHRHASAQALLVAVIVFDLYAFNPTILNRREQRQPGADSLEEMRSLRPVAEYLESRPGLFRVQNEPSFPVSGMGDAYGIQTTFGASVTMLDDYWRAVWSPNAACLLNVGYSLGRVDKEAETPVFSSDQWKVFENPAPCPRAWVVGQAAVEPAAEVSRRVEHDTLDVQHVAYLSEPLPSPLPSPSNAAAAAPAEITYGEYRPDRFELDADVSATGLLVVSEIYYPGWRATINGQSAHIYKVDSILRGLLVAPGRNHIVMEYRPRSLRLGMILSLAAFLGTFLFAAIVFFARRRHP